MLLYSVVKVKTKIKYAGPPGRSRGADLDRHSVICCCRLGDGHEGAETDLKKIKVNI